MAFEKFKEMGNLIKQAKEMKSKMGEIQKQLKKTELMAEGNLVKLVKVNGEMEALEFVLDSGIGLDDKARKKLEEELKSVTNKALKKAKDEATSKLSAVTGGFKIPGMT